MSARRRNLIKLGLAGALVRGLPLLQRARRLAGGPRVHVLGYHRVVERVPLDAPLDAGLCISVDSFARQMRQVRERFTVLPLHLGVAALAGGFRLDRDACVVTFDDGYRDVLERAYPILAALDIPATVFVPTLYAGAERPLPHDRLFAALWGARRATLSLGRFPVPRGRLETVRFAWLLLRRDGPGAAVGHLIARLPAEELGRFIEGLEGVVGELVPEDRGGLIMAPRELRQLAGAGWEIGAHTAGHVVLTLEPLERVRRELSGPREVLQAWTGRPCRYFAYCNGLRSPELIAEVHASGYEAALTTWDRPNQRGVDPFEIRRKVLCEGHTRGLDGRWSSAVSAAHLHDLFGTLRLTSPVPGAVRQERAAWPR